MQGIWEREEILAIHPLIERILSTDIKEIRSRLERGELALGDDMEPFDDFL